MFSTVTFLWLCLVILTTESGAFLLNEHTNTSVGHPDNGNYNIYSKIDALERTLQKLETSVREKTTHSDTLMRQVLLTVNEMDVKLESSDLRNMSLEMKKIQDLVGNISGKSCFLLIVYRKLIVVGLLERMRQSIFYRYLKRDHYETQKYHNKDVPAAKMLSLLYMYIYAQC